MVDALVTAAPEIKSIVDFGCGTGVYLSEFQKRGIQGVGYEHSQTARRLASKFYGLDVQPFDVAAFPGVSGRFDACLCIEIAHYMPEELGRRLVEICARSAPLIIFSSAHPQQGGQGHINEQPRTYWVEHFVRLGCTFDADRTSEIESRLKQRVGRGKWLAENICVFTAPVQP
jgi:SAM-dependent methyltransferase